MKKLWPGLLIIASIGCSSEPSRETADAPPAASSRPPNLLLVSIDTLRADRLSCYGYQEMQTPQIDGLAAQGIVFEQAFTPVPITLPAHASLLTGTLALYHGVRENSGFVLPAEQVTLAEALQHKGYRTGAFVGSFVLDSGFGLDQGFERYDDDFGSRPDELQTIQMQAAERPAEQVLEAARQWVGQPSDKPFFAWVHLFDPHAPYAPPEGTGGKEGYDAEVSYVDRSLGRFLSFLKQRRLYESTLIVLTADHGEGLGEHGEDTHGMFLYDSTLRVPLIFKLPQRSGEGIRVAEQVRLIDVMPTILRLADAPIPETVQGESLQRAWAGGTLPELPLYAETLMPLLDYGWSDLSALRTARYKWIEAPRPELYELTSDPAEQSNRYRSEQALANQLRAQQQQLASSRRQSDSAQAWRPLDPETAERLRSLGYAALAAPVQTGADPLQQWRSRYPAPLADPKDKIELFNRLWEAQHYTAQGDQQRSRRLLDGVLREDPGIFMAHSVQALNLLELGDPGQALIHLRRCVELRPEEPGAHLYRGMAAFRLGNLDEAVRAFETALQLDPRNRAARNNLAAAYGAQQRYDKASEILQAILDENPEDPAAALNLGTAYLMQGKDEQARQALEQALQRNPRIPEAYNNLGLISLNAGDAEEAAKQLRKAISLNPTYAKAHLNLARAYDLLGNAEDASKHRELARQLEERR